MYHMRTALTIFFIALRNATFNYDNNTIKINQIEVIIKQLLKLKILLVGSCEIEGGGALYATTWRGVDLKKRLLHQHAKTNLGFIFPLIKLQA